MQVCPTRLQTQHKQAQPYFVAGINRGDGGLAPSDLPAPSASSSSRLSAARRAAWSALPPARAEALLAQVRRVHGALTAQGLTPYESHLPAAECLPFLDAAVHRERASSFNLKHGQQQAAIAGQLQRAGLLASVDVALVECGAGRGYLASMLAESFHIRRAVLVERSKVRYKADRFLKRSQAVESTHRLTIDLADLRLDAVDCLAGCRVVGIGKHLCGAATDFSLRCLTALPPPTRGVEEGDDTVAHARTPTLLGLGIATCCHHRCEWAAYVGKAFFEAQGWGEEEFALLSWMTGWAASGRHTEDREEDSDAPAGVTAAAATADEASEPAQGEEEEAQAGSEGGDDDEGIPATAEASGGGHILDPVDLGRDDKALLGHQIKDLIDVGRVLFLQGLELGSGNAADGGQSSFKGEVVQYVPRSVTPENRLLVASATVAPPPT